MLSNCFQNLRKNDRQKCNLYQGKQEGQKKRKLLSTTTSDPVTLIKSSRGESMSNHSTRDAIKGVNYFELNEGLSLPRSKKGHGKQPQYNIVSALRYPSET